MSSTKPTIKVRTKDVIAIHWFNAFFWLTLVLTGFGIISGDFVRLAPAFWPTFLQNLLGGNANLVLLHGIGGMVWAGVIGVYALLNFKRVVLPFLKNVLVLTPKAAIADMSSMVITLAHLFGLLKHKSVPPQGRYNGAQRLLGTMIIACSLAIAVTGIYLFLSPMLLDFAASAGVLGGVFRWALVIHLAAVLLVLLGLVAHIYFAVVEEPESLETMKSGEAEVAFIKHHNPLWYAELEREGKV
ncbi:cytochrome b/b6 domain-containing protein [Thiothrix fructosivorans]|jgi:formate dehydrogenase subunit gamma|uniref:Cytochrome b/b6 domain-containing protein n=1 Tax=Thiothrix fructosivorans TaxID=111770 RepID=A0A8B0SJQ7_9GAMM|nr:cytochrome b/b6 domain-containing protein [Thiothrix fructosivorans]MBO0611639.1 cytochrome b/b6 domain-containing protein [Thiothrix fructosivorans]QTX10700.1 cytochrome b/b6 domain-containing protein [Thiothrix fructosivorans]